MISTAAKKKAITSAKRHDKDSGSPEVQVSVLTERITSLQDHFRANPKDHGSRRGLLLMVGQRNRLLRYLSTIDRERYNALIQKLGLRK
ncbi:MAG: 30S ribosomal protein S15 [Planctomycetes bacterium]|jgi:small subunit ribosomal protein S15|nr:30S ribosomal protein S15 [Planctomycetota bacterium]